MIETDFHAVGNAVVALAFGHAYVSEGDEGTWREIVLPAGGGVIRKIAESAAGWLALSEHATLYQSSDAGRSWRPFGQQLSTKFKPAATGFEHWYDLACRGEDVYVVTTTHLIRADRHGKLQHAWTLPPRPQTKPKTQREKMALEMGAHLEFLVDIDLDPAAQLDLVRANTFGLYRVPVAGNHLEPYGERAPLTPGMTGVGQFARARGRILVAASSGLELDGVPISSEPQERAEAAVAALDPSLPAWLHGLVYAMKSYVRGLVASPWSDDDWLVADDDGVHVVGATGMRCVWRSDALPEDVGLIKRMAVVGSSLWFGFHRARPDAAGIVLREGGVASTVRLPASRSSA